MKKRAKGGGRPKKAAGESVLPKTTQPVEYLAVLAAYFEASAGGAASRPELERKARDLYGAHLRRCSAEYEAFTIITRGKYEFTIDESIRRRPDSRQNYMVTVAQEVRIDPGRPPSGMSP